MLNELFGGLFKVNPVLIAGSCLWSLALYIGFSSVREWLIVQMERWFNFAERSFYVSGEEYEKTRTAREMVNSLYAAVFSIVPFLFLGFVTNYLVEIALGNSWGISLGMLATISCGIYELGKHDSNRKKE